MCINTDNKNITIINNKENMELDDDKSAESCKRILCYNIINNKACSYGNKCLYAHSLSEQKIDTIRHKVYTILKNNNNLSELNLVNDNKLFKTMLELTKLCSLCIKHMCPGGYNCRNGSVNINYRICYEDMMYGYCRRLNCTSLHLSKRGLVSYYEQKERKNEDSFKPKKFIRSKSMMSNISGILLTEKFLLAHLGAGQDNNVDSDSEGEEEVTKVINYLNESSEDASDNESIFD